MPRFFRPALAACCLLACVPALAAPAAPSAIALCYERQDVPPWRMADGHGLNVDLLDAVARQTGLRFAYQSMPWKRCLELLKANAVDGAFTVSFSRERMALGVYPGGANADPERRLHTDNYVLVRRRGSKVGWDGKSFSNIDGRIGIQLGYSVGDFLRAHDIAVDEGSQRSDELLEKLLAGRVTAAALGGATAARLMRLPQARVLEQLPVPLIEKPYYLLLSHAFVARHPELAERIWKTIAQVRSSAAWRRREHDALEGR
jgi:polar amino acid transport system substrate-binding protein